MTLFWIITGYLAGSIPTGFLVVKAIKGIDIRTVGSGNIGATNSGRLLGKKWAVFIAIFDMLKGGIILLIASCFTQSSTAIALVGTAAVLGHNYPIWLSFRGGKGVATTFGVFGFFDFFNPFPAIIGGCCWYLLMKKTKYVSVASMAALFVATFLMPIFGMERAYYASGLFLSLLAVWRHRENILRIKEGTEIKVNKR